MKRAILSAALAVAFMADVSAQDKPNFVRSTAGFTASTTLANSAPR